MTDRRMTGADIIALNEQEGREARQRMRDFVDAAAVGDAERMLAEIDQIEFGSIHHAGWSQVMRRVAKLGSVPKRTREEFRRLYIRSGDHLRGEAGHDLALIAGLRVLLPPYRGGSKVLYRGQGALAPRSRDYGLSWTASRAVAEGHAKGLWRDHRGGSVLLKALAQPAAIISRIPRDEDRYGEIEYLVDRRRLHRVTIVASYPESPEAVEWRQNRERAIEREAVNNPLMRAWLARNRQGTS
jgi:hypothetical protein